MTTLATALKSEIVHAAQKTLRGETQSLRKAASNYEREIASLQRRVTSLEQMISRLRGSRGHARPALPRGARAARHLASGTEDVNGAPADGEAASSSAPARRASRAPVLAIAGDSEDSGTALRFSAKGFTKLRQRLGLSAAAMGTLLGVTAQSVYKWEDGKARPRATQLQAISAVRKMGKRKAAAHLASLEGAHEQHAETSDQD